MNHTFKNYFILPAICILASCADSVEISTLKNLPPISHGKSRIVHIMDQKPMMWRLSPLYISIDGKQVAKTTVERIAVNEIEPGRRLVTVLPFKTINSKQGASYDFKKGVTHYIGYSAQYKGSSKMGIVGVEFTEAQAESLIGSKKYRLKQN